MIAASSPRARAGGPGRSPASSRGDGPHLVGDPVVGAHRLVEVDEVVDRGPAVRQAGEEELEVARAQVREVDEGGGVDHGIVAQRVRRSEREVGVTSSKLSSGAGIARDLISMCIACSTS